MAWDQGALSARSGDASKRLQSLADKLRVLQTSAAAPMRSFRRRFGTKESQQCSGIIEQTAAEQRTSCRLNEPN